MPEFFCSWESACLFSHYAGAMRAAVSINLLASAWIWLYQQSGRVRTKVYDQVGGTLGIVEGQSAGGSDLKARIEAIVKEGESKIRGFALTGVGVAAAASVLILLMSFFVRDDIPWGGVAWWATLAITFSGPVAMLIVYFMIEHCLSKALDSANRSIHDHTNEMVARRPTPSPTPPWERQQADKQSDPLN